MSQENVEVLRRVFEAFSKGDVETMARLMYPDVEWRPALLPGGIEQNAYVGHEGLRRWMTEVAESWEAFEVIDVSFESVGDRVLARGHVRGRGAASGVEIESPLYQVAEIEDGKVRRAAGFLSEAEALEAAGLGEPGSAESRPS